MPNQEFKVEIRCKSNSMEELTSASVKGWMEDILHGCEEWDPERMKIIGIDVFPIGPFNTKEKAR